MQKLDRTICAEPGCLASYQHGRHSWSDVTNDDRAEIRSSLEDMQGRRCAYCEGSLDTLGNHIEHFRRRGHHPHLTFEWTNLYWSCDQRDSCGRYKDDGAGTYDVDNLVDPCVEDPDVFFRFRSDGTIAVRPGLQQPHAHKARETLRVFGLNPEWGRLRNMRKAAVAAYVALVDGCAGFAPNELQDFFREELVAAARSPFFTAIRHVLTEV